MQVASLIYNWTTPATATWPKSRWLIDLLQFFSIFFFSCFDFDFADNLQTSPIQYGCRRDSRAWTCRLPHANQIGRRTSWQSTASCASVRWRYLRFVPSGTLAAADAGEKPLSERVFDCGHLRWCDHTSIQGSYGDEREGALRCSATLSLCWWGKWRGVRKGFEIDNWYSSVLCCSRW